MLKHLHLGVARRSATRKKMQPLTTRQRWLFSGVKGCEAIYRHRHQTTPTIDDFDNNLSTDKN